MFIFLLALSGFALEESLLQTAQIPADKYSTVKQPGLPDTDTARFTAIGAKNLKSVWQSVQYYKPADFDPDYSYSAVSTKAAVEAPSVQDGYRVKRSATGVEDPNKQPFISTPFWTSKAADSKTNKNSKFAADGNWAGSRGAGKPEPDKKFLTSGTIGYNWKFHELTEKSYEKSVNTVASGGTASNDDSTISQLINNEEKVKNTADSTKTTVEDSKVYSGKGKTSLLQTKADVTTVTQTSDKGYDQLKYNDATKTTGTVGGSSRFQTGTYQNAAGGSYQSTIEKPKVTATKTGTVDVEWRGGDSYTTSKMLNSIKKFIKRASRSEAW